MPRSPVRQVLIASLSVVLVAALAFVAFGSWLPPRQAFRGTMKDLVPQAEELPRWTLEYRPVAETAEMQKAVGEILNFDDAVYAIYDNGGLRVSIYAAYWSPGKMSHRLIAGHTPDVCWVGGGWVRRKAESLGMKIESRKEGAEERTAARGQKPDDGGQTTEDRGQLVRRSLGEGGRSEVGGQRPEAGRQTTESGGRLAATKLEGRRREGETAVLPMEYREFQLGGQTEYVVFGHMVGGRSMSYGTGGLPPWYGFLGDLWARGFQQREEQFFVRISSNRSLAEFKDAPPVQVFLRRLSVELEKMRRGSGE